MIEEVFNRRADEFVAPCIQYTVSRTAIQSK